MKRRILLKLSVIVLTVALLCVIASYWLDIYVSVGTPFDSEVMLYLLVDVCRGDFYFQYADEQIGVNRAFGGDWWGSFSHIRQQGGHLITLVLPGWLVVLLLSAYPVPMLAYGLLRRKPIPPGHCEKCGYNLKGNVSGVCPECGEKMEAV